MPARIKPVDKHYFVLCNIFCDTIFLVSQVSTVLKLYSWCCNWRAICRATSLWRRWSCCLISPSQKPHKANQQYFLQPPWNIMYEEIWDKKTTKVGPTWVGKLLKIGGLLRCQPHKQATCQFTVPLVTINVTLAILQIQTKVLSAIQITTSTLKNTFCI